MPLLFVYGTLKRGERNNHLLAGGEFLGPARTLPCYRLLDLGTYPCLVTADVDGVAVEGELWRVSADVLRALDEFEEVPAVFDRRPVAVAGQGGDVYGYLYQRDVTGLPNCGTAWPPAGAVNPPT